MPSTAAPIVCLIFVLTSDQLALLGYAEEVGIALTKGPKVGSFSSALAAEVVAGSRSYSLSNCAW